MSKDELDLQRVLASATTRYVELIGDMTNSSHRYECITKANSKQNPSDPNGVGVDVLAVLGSSKLILMELKRCRFDENNNPELGKFSDGQIDLLVRLAKHPMVETYVVSNTVTDFDCRNLEHGPGRALLQLSRLTVTTPLIASKLAQKGLKFFVGPNSICTTVLDIFTRALLDPTTAAAEEHIDWLEILEEYLDEMTNCVLWFIGDGYIVGMSAEEFKSALPHLVRVQSIPEGRILVEAFKAMRAAKNRSAAPDVQLSAEQQFNAAQAQFLVAVKQLTLDARVPESLDYDDDVDTAPQLGWDGP